MKRVLLVISLVVLSKYSFEQVKVACIGNSITAAGYPAYLGEMLGDGWEVKNFGVSGSTMLHKGDLPYYKTTEYSKARDYQPDVVIIKLGTNDSKPHNWKFGNDFYNDYCKMIKELRALPSQPVVFVCYPVPAYNRGWGIDDSVIKHAIIPKIKWVAHEENVKLIDLYKPLNNHRAFFPDGIHPNNEGSKAIAGEVARMLKKFEKKIQRRSYKSDISYTEYHDKPESTTRYCRSCGFYFAGLQHGMPIYCNCYF